jgi:LytS/YehU family sensor histidine kinase
MVSFKMVWDLMYKLKEVEQLQSLVKESELQFLKSQINPHFLFNNLNNLYAYAMENSAKTPSIILELSSVLRYMLYDCKENKVALSKEIQHLENFVKLNELQIENRGIISFNNTISNTNFTIAPLILMVFIENAFKHAMASQTDKIQIKIDLKMKENKLYFSCENSFLEMKNNDSLHKGIGLQNVKKRLELLYPEKYDLQIDTKNGIYVVHLNLDLD